MSCTKGDSSGLLQSLAAATASGSLSTTSGASKVLSTTNWFTTEIQQMMWVSLEAVHVHLDYWLSRIYEFNLSWKRTRPLKIRWIYPTFTLITMFCRKLFKFLDSKAPSTVQKFASGLPQQFAEMSGLKRIWRCSTKVQLDKSLVTSILRYGCETWTLLADSERRIQAFETKCVRKLIRFSYLEHKTNDRVRS